MAPAAQLTLANQLTLLRIVLIPAFVIFVLYGQLGYALAAFLTAGLTDALDGLIARRTGKKTTLGAWLDPLADKLLLVTAFIVLTVPNTGLQYRLPVWLTILVISRDSAIVLTVAVVNLAIGRRTFAPSMLGKVATAVYILTCLIVLTGNYVGGWEPLIRVAVISSAAITVFSAVHYAGQVMKILNS
jgi:cardiolipin synthase